MSRGISLEPDDGIRDKIQYKVKADDKGIKVKVEYKEEYKKESEDEDISDIATQFEVQFDRIVEYAKPAQTGDDEELSDDEQAYDWDKDEILQTIPLTEWQEFGAIVDDEDGVLSYFSAQSMDGMALFNFTISRADIGEKMNANTMKIDVLLTNFPWMRADTNLALMSTVNSKLKVKMDYNDEAALERQLDTKAKWAREVQISFDDATKDIGFVPTGEYKWQDLAEAKSMHTNMTLKPNTACANQTVLDSKSADLYTECGNMTAFEEDEEEESATIRVIATSPPQNGNETFQVIAYSFVGSAAQNASEIYWDPEAGIGYSAAWGSAYSALLNIGSAVAVSGMLILVL